MRCTGRLWALDVGWRPVRGELVPVLAGERGNRGEGAALVLEDCRVAVDLELHDGEHHLDVVFVDDVDGVHAQDSFPLLRKLISRRVMGLRPRWLCERHFPLRRSSTFPLTAER
jgi:hypothetical protein